MSNTSVLNTTSNATATVTAGLVRVNWYYSARFWVSFGVAGIPLNLLEAICIYIKKKHKTVFGLTLSSLCVADILGSICFMVAGALRLFEYNGPLTVRIQPNTSFSTSWRAGHAALFFSVGTSFVHIMIIAIQRLSAVLWPIMFKTWFTRKRCAILLTATWISLFVSGAIGYFFIQWLWTASYYFMLVTGIILIICYTVICSKSWIDTKRRQLIIASGRRKYDVEKTVSMSLAVTMAFLVCTCPQAIFYLYIVNDQDLTFYHLVNSIISINPCLDAIIYFSFYNDCRSCAQNKKQDHTVSTPVSRRQKIASISRGIQMKTILASQDDLRNSVPSFTI